jgi:hypothetical protein
MGNKKATKNAEAGYQPQVDQQGQAIKGYQPDQKPANQELNPPSGGSNVTQTNQNTQQSNTSKQKED